MSDRVKKFVLHLGCNKETEIWEDQWEEVFNNCGSALQSKSRLFRNGL